jgi:hypothetical protein
MPRSDTQFKRGNPDRPKGARSKLSDAFIQAISTDFEEHGLKALVEMREKRAGDYIKVVASLLPRDAKLELQTRNLGLVDLLSDINEQGLR